MPEDVIITNGAGNFAKLGPSLPPLSPPRHAGSPHLPVRWVTAVPAGVAAKALHPGREVITFAGDGDFMMQRPGIRDRRAV